MADESKAFDKPDAVAAAEKALRGASVYQLTGHKKKCNAVAWSCSGNTLASGSNDGTAKLWSVSSSGKGREVGTLKGHSGSIDQLGWHPSNSSTLATAASDKTVRIWDSRAAKSVAKIATPGENINIVWSRDGKTIAVGNKNEMVSMIDVRRGKIMRKVRFQCEVNEMVWHPKQDLLMLATGHKKPVVDEGIIEVMRVKNYALQSVRQVKAHCANAYCIDITRDGKKFATGGADGLVCVFDTDHLACIRSFDRLEWPVRSVSLSHDAQFVASGSEDHFVSVNNVVTGERVRALMTSDPTNCVAWHPSQHVLAFVGDDKNSSQVGMVQIVSMVPRSRSSTRR